MRRKFHFSVLFFVFFVLVNSSNAQVAKSEKRFGHYLSASAGISNCYGRQMRDQLCGFALHGTYQLYFKQNVFTARLNLSTILEFNIFGSNSYPDNSFSAIELQYGKNFIQKRFSFTPNMGITFNRFVTRGQYDHYERRDFLSGKSYYQTEIGYYLGLPLNLTAEYQLEKKKHVYGFLQPNANFNALETIVGINTGLKFKL